MKPVLIGSRALAWHHNTLNLKEDKDYDVISDEPIDGCEWHDPSILLNEHIADIYRTNFTIKINGVEVYIMSLKGLKIIKRSHLHRDLAFQKHITYYDKYLKNINLNATDQTLLDIRTKETKLLFKDNHPKLNTT